MENNIKIHLDEKNINDERISIHLEQDFDNLEILSLKISSSDVYRRTSADFGVIVGRVQTTNGYGLQNAKISIFVPITADDKQRPEITELYPFETVNDQYPNGVRYNLLPRVRNNNPSHRAVGNLPTVNDLTFYPQYVEIMEKYYKYTTTTNDSGDYMIFGVPVGLHSIMMDFDLFDTKSFEISANDLVETTTQYKNITEIAAATNTADSNNPNKVPNFIYKGSNNFDVEVKTNINEMPNIFNEIKQITVSPFWGDDQFDVGITRCDFKINYKYTPTAIFFGWVASPSASYYIKDDYSWSKDLNKDSLEFWGFDKTLNRETGDVWPINSLKVVVYKLDDKLNPGSRVRIGEFDAEPGTGIFRISLPMYTDYYKVTQFGDLVPTDDTENGIPTKGYYAFELYDGSDFYNIRVPWGGYPITPTPGFRIPASPTGEELTGGWEGTNTGLFEYDLVNRKRKFYTLKTTYNKHTRNNMSIAGDYLNYFPDVNLNKDIQWNFPIERKNVSLINDTAIIGSALIPRYFFDFKPGFNYDLIDDKNYDPDVLFPANVLNLIYLNQDLTYNEPIKKYQYHTGIGSGLNGLNQGTVYTDLFQASDFIDKGNGNNFYGESRTYNFGDNSDGPLNLSLYAIELTKNKQATANGYGVHGRYTQAVNETYTWGPFISSTDSKNSFPVLQTEIYDITDELQDLIDNKVYTSYGFYTGNVAPSSFDAEISNRFKGNFYYFGLWEGANSLITIEKNYFKTNE